MERLIILTNSPGEISGWVRPVCEELCSRRTKLEILLAVLPCPYASGSEESYGAKIAGVSRSMRYKKLWKAPPPSGKNLILQLGGDPFYGFLLSKKLKCDWMIYTSRPKFTGSVKKYFLPDDAAEARFAKTRLRRWRYAKVGNLILDSVPKLDSKRQARAALGINEEEYCVTFLPGSRPFEYKPCGAFFSVAAQELLSRYENLNAYIALAPTADESIFRQGLDEAGIKYASVGGKITNIAANGNGSIHVVREEGFAAIKASELAVALPGTNNLQIAMLGTPLLMVAPLNYAEEIPLDGLPGLLPFKWPVFKQIKKRLVLYANKKTKYVSLPNRIANAPIVPEHRRIMTPLTVAGLADELLADPAARAEILRGYGRIKFERGAAKKIADAVENHFDDRSRHALSFI